MGDFAGRFNIDQNPGVRDHRLSLSKALNAVLEDSVIAPTQSTMHGLRLSFHQDVAAVSLPPQLRWDQQTYHDELDRLLERLTKCALDYGFSININPRGQFMDFAVKLESKKDKLAR